MASPYLEVTFVRGRPFAAYLYLERPEGAKVDHTAEARPGVLVDYARDGTPMGVEIVHPAHTPEQTVLDVLGEIGAHAVAAEDLAPLRAA